MASDQRVPRSSRYCANPAKLLAQKIETRRAVDSRTRVSIPGDRLLEQSVRWSKQNLADSVPTARDLQLRAVSAGTEFPATQGTLAKIIRTARGRELVTTTGSGHHTLVVRLR